MQQLALEQRGLLGDRASWHGVREGFRRRGLGAAVCTFGLHRWHAEGGTRAIVYCVEDVARALYRSIGFEIHATMVGYSR